jgi:8-oxo-dGTP pyrophosphatase MutT (NUDIX family)
MLFAKKPSDFYPHSEAVGCYVQCNGQFLLLFNGRKKIKAYSYKWGLPAGLVEEGEFIEQAMWRELYEETGLNSHEFKYEKSFYVRRGWRDFPFHIFKLLVDERPDIHLSDEHDGYCWVNPNRALGFPLVPDQKKCIQLCYPDTG